MYNDNLDRPIILMLPFAGGDSHSYKKINLLLENDFEIWDIELPGRGSLINEPFISDIIDLSDYLFEKYITKLNENRTYIIFGHSMGALLAYELSHLIKSRKYKAPLHLIISGIPVPFLLKTRKRKMYKLSSNKFKCELKKMGGISDKVLFNNELMNYFEPILRADFKAVETYKYEYPKKMLNIPMTVIYGKADKMINSKFVHLWDNETINEVNFIELQGGHFCIFDKPELISSYLKIAIKK